ncbi:MAG: TIGR02300 family protein [Filomicrobium sp.]
MQTVDARGTKRTCQNPDCGGRFYDLNRDPIICPLCGSEYVIAHAPVGAVVEEPKEKAPVRTAEEETQTDETAAAEDGELADIETDESIPDDDDDSDTFLEDEEDDNGNVTDIIPGISDGDSEET